MNPAILPKMTHLQFAIAERIPTGGIFAVDLAKRIGVDGPKFYQAMRRMIKAGWVEQNKSAIYGRRAGTWYVLTKNGAAEGQRSLAFYLVESNVLTRPTNDR